MIDTHHSASFSRNEGFKKNHIHDICGGRIDVTMTIIEAQVRLHCQFRFFQASWTYLQTDPSHDWVAYELLKRPGGKKSKLGGNSMSKSCSLGLPNYSNDCGFRMRPLKNTHQLFFQSVLCFSQWWAHLASHIHTWSNISFSSWIRPSRIF